ncbi:MAG: radical SAM family heme chaperone HemW [Bacteroidales bacterium]|nr:radical SAM family heme chaperone HemW [Bacteroidales bacterium]
MIYIHIPFCRSFCTYCDFYSEIASRCCKDEQLRFDRFASALSAEIASYAGVSTGDVNTLYIGGGTPSVLPLSVIEQIAGALREHGFGGPYDEFTVEVNPDDIVEKGETYVEGLLRLGVNRISMGVQSFDDDILRWMNRRHDSAAAREAYAILERTGVPDISVDLIFGLSQLSDEQWRATLRSALEISPSDKLPAHISSYQLSVEPGSALASLVDRGAWTEASDELCARQYDILCSELRTAGYEHYEISNFALPGHRAQHNSAYWDHSQYLGLGPGAHGFLDGRRFWNNPSLDSYVKAAADSDFSAVRGFEDLTDEQVVLERVMLGLRTCAGVDADFLRAHCPDDALMRAISAGDLIPSGSRLRIPESRFFVSDAIISELV